MLLDARCVTVLTSVLHWHTPVEACCVLWENERNLVLFSPSPSGLSHSIPTPLHHTIRLYNYPPPPSPVSTLFTSLWSCTGVISQQLAKGEQNVFGVCLVSNRIVLIVSGCHFARWRGPFPTGESERLKGSSLEGGKGRGRGQSLSPQQHQQQPYCTHTQTHTSIYIVKK